MTKAKIIVIDGGTYGKCTFSQGEKIEVQFNPTEYSISAQTVGKSKYKGPGGEKKAVFYDFKTSEPRTLHVKLLYDTSMQGYQEAAAEGFRKPVSDYEKNYKQKNDVNKLYIEKLLALLKSGEKSKLPPRIVFAWGSTSFRGYAVSIQVSYQRFNERGEPSRAEIDFSIQETEDGEPDSPGQPETEGDNLLSGDEPMGLDELF